MAYIREATIEKALVGNAEKRGGLAYKLTVPGRRNAPDRLLIMPGGRLIFVECKAPGQKPRPGQVREIARLRGLGCEAHVLDSVDSDWIFDGLPEDWPEQHDADLNLSPPSYKHLPAYPPAPPLKTCCNRPHCTRLRFAGGLCLRHWREYTDELTARKV